MARSRRTTTSTITARAPPKKRSREEEKAEQEPPPQPKEKQRKINAEIAESSSSGRRTPQKKKKAKTEKEKQEKRAKKFIPRPSRAVEERIQRAFEHRLYLIERKQSSEGFEFAVLGATGNVYTVSISVLPSCTCPDFLRGNTCKHILFVMLRVLKLPPDDPRVWQKALLSSELEDLRRAFESGAVTAADDVVADRRVRDRFREISGQNRNEEEKSESGVEQRSLEGDCLVCYENLQKAKEAVVFCKTCGNNVHKDCFERWSRSRRSNGGSVTCVYCRAPWESENDKAKGKGKSKDQPYVNLAAYSEGHSREDLSLEALYPDSSPWIRWRHRG